MCYSCKYDTNCSSGSIISLSIFLIFLYLNTFILSHSSSPRLHSDRAEGEFTQSCRCQINTDRIYQEERAQVRWRTTEIFLRLLKSPRELWGMRKYLRRPPGPAVTLPFIFPIENVSDWQSELFYGLDRYKTVLVHSSVQMINNRVRKYLRLG